MQITVCSRNCVNSGFACRPEELGLADIGAQSADTGAGRRVPASEPTELAGAGGQSDRLH